jgi:hypothetical protein
VEDDVRRDAHPEREMAFWADMARFYEHFTQGKAWALGRKKELFGVLMACLGGGPKQTPASLHPAPGPGHRQPRQASHG